jgi:hypothetical protein
MIDFTVISSKNMQLQIPSEARGPRVEGKDMAIILLFIPFGSPNLKEAVDRAIESAGPGYDALVDGVLYRQNYYFVVGWLHGYKIIGTPIKTSLVNVSLRGGGKDLGQSTLYHSSSGISNDAALTDLKNEPAPPRGTQPPTTQQDRRVSTPIPRNEPAPPEGMVLIPAGKFQMGSNAPAADNDEKPVHTVSIDAFYMDKYKVTNAQYKQFVLASPRWQKKSY